MSELAQIFRDAIIVASGGSIVTGAIVGAKKLHEHSKKKRLDRIAMEKKRDETLALLASTLAEMRKDQKAMGEDVRSLYPIQLVQLESLEISLMAIHGDGLNGNVGDAIKAVRKAKKDITDRVCSKVCADIGEEVD